MQSAESSSTRIESIDALRGTIMVLMALDHVRDYIHRAAMMQQQPTALATTTPALFFTRWITHFCAPVFMLTAGMGIFFVSRRRESKQAVSMFLITRGAWLMFLELTLMQLAYNFDVSTSYPVFLLVFWILGACMICMAALIWIPVFVLAPLSVLTIALHNTLDQVAPAQLGIAPTLWKFLHQPGLVQFAGLNFIVGYQLIPWVAVMALGFCIARVFLLEPARRQSLLLWGGIAAITLFIAIRALNIYGDPSPRVAQPRGMFTLLSFLNTTKYPPSLDFLLMTLGPACVLLSAFDRIAPTAANPLVILGRVPQFYFIGHFTLAHVSIVLLSLVQYGGSAWSFVFGPVPSMGGDKKLFPPNFGYELWVVYAVWAAIVLGLYPVCRWFARVKATRRDWWLSYL